MRLRPGQDARQGRTILTDAGPRGGGGESKERDRRCTFVVHAKIVLAEADVVVLVLGAPRARQRGLVLVDHRVEQLETIDRLVRGAGEPFLGDVGHDYPRSLRTPNGVRLNGDGRTPDEDRLLAERGRGRARARPTQIVHTIGAHANPHEHRPLRNSSPRSRAGGALARQRARTRTQTHRARLSTRSTSPGPPSPDTHAYTT